MRHAKKIIITILGLGGVFWCMGAMQPVYTDPKAPERLSHELQDHPRDQRFREWYAELSSYETSHKRLTDLGRGLIALGLGVGLALGLMSLFRHFESGSRVRFFAIAWIGLWALKIPFTAWYYGLRQKRFDFPVWGDSVAIPVMSETMTWIIGCALTGIIAALLMIRHSFNSSLMIGRPLGVVAWIRVSVLWLWAALLLVCVASGVWDGDEGMVISCLGACPLLYALITATPVAPRPT